MLTLVLLTAAAQVQVYHQHESEQFRTRLMRVPRAGGRAGAAAASFEFAPTSGAGMGTACACTTPTGAKGETLTFTRTGSATCSKKGMANTGIANGDLVTCSGNQPRVEPSGGVLGLRVEASRTNSCLQSEDFSSAAWSKLGGPTITADAATAPDNATTADRVQFAATGVGASSLVYQIAAPVGAATCSVYARMTSGTGSLPMYVNLGGLYACATCSITDSSWTRCTVSGTVVSNGTFNIGNESFAGVCFGALPALDVRLWGAQCESGSFATGYIPTTSAAATRNAEVAGFAISTPTTAGVCSAATIEVPSLNSYVSGSGAFAPVLSSGAVGSSPTSPYLWPYSAATGSNLSIDGAGSTGAPTGWGPSASPPTLLGRYVAGHNGTAWSICVNGACSSNSTPSSWLSPTYSSVRLYATTATNSSAIWTRVQVDPSFPRCAP